MNFPTLSIRQLLAGLVLATTVPLLALALMMFERLIAFERQSVREGLVSNARSLAALIDNEIDTHAAVAASLATSPHLQNGDFGAFRVQATQSLEFLSGAGLRLSDPQGRTVMTTLQAVGDEMLLSRDTLTKAWVTGRSQVSDIVTWPVSQRQTAFIAYPVFKDGSPFYSIVVDLNPERLFALIEKKFGGQAMIGVIDRNYKFLARTPGHNEKLGTPASEGWQAAMARTPAGIAEFSTLEGTPSVTAYAPTRDGWTVGIAYPLTAMNAPVHRILGMGALLSASVVALSLAFGAYLGGRLSRSMSRLAAAARKVGHGEVVTEKASGFREAAAIGEALSVASHELARRETALGESETKYRGVFENAAVGVGLVGPDGRWRDVNQRLCEIVGYTRAELQRQRFRDLVHPDDLQAHSAEASKLLAGKQSGYTAEKRYLRKDGSTVWVGVTAASQCDEGGAPSCIIVVVRDITARKEAQEHQRFLLNELAHRSKNQLAVIQAMVSQTAHTAGSLQEFVERLGQRLRALAISIDLLVAEDKLGAPLAEVVRQQLGAFEISEPRLIIEGPDISVSGDAAHAIGLALHELATIRSNTARGHRRMGWSRSVGFRMATGPSRLRLDWVEKGGPLVTPPRCRGFGQAVIEHMVAQKLEATVELKFLSEGLRWTLSIPPLHFSPVRSGEGGDAAKLDVVG